MCGIQPINEWMKRRRRRKWEVNVTRLDAERLFKISRNNITAGRKSPGPPKRRWLKQAESPIINQKKK